MTTAETLTTRIRRNLEEDGCPEEIIKAMLRHVAAYEPYIDLNTVKHAGFHDPDDGLTEVVFQVDDRRLSIYPQGSPETIDEKCHIERDVATSPAALAKWLTGETT